MSSKERMKRIKQYMETAEYHPYGYWWLSFTDDHGFLGVAIVKCEGTIADASMEAWKHKCNPGGNMKASYYPINYEGFKNAPINTLMNEDTLLTLGLIKKETN